MRLLNPRCPNFLDTSNLDFTLFHNALDICDLRTTGVVLKVFQRKLLQMKKNIYMLWESKVLGGARMLRAYCKMYSEINFCLQGGEE